MSTTGGPSAPVAQRLINAAGELHALQHRQPALSSDRQAWSSVGQNLLAGSARDVPQTSKSSSHLFYTRAARVLWGRVPASIPVTRHRNLYWPHIYARDSAHPGTANMSLEITHLTAHPLRCARRCSRPGTEPALSARHALCCPRHKSAPRCWERLWCFQARMRLVCSLPEAGAVSASRTVRAELHCLCSVEQSKNEICCWAWTRTASHWGRADSISLASQGLHPTTCGSA